MTQRKDHHKTGLPKRLTQQKTNPITLPPSLDTRIAPLKLVQVFFALPRP